MHRLRITQVTDALWQIAEFMHSVPKVESVTFVLTFLLVFTIVAVPMLNEILSYIMLYYAICFYIPDKSHQEYTIGRIIHFSISL